MSEILSRCLQENIIQAFALQNGGVCYSGANAHKDYAKFGVSNACVNGKGGYHANDVYMFGQGTNLTLLKPFWPIYTLYNVIHPFMQILWVSISTHFVSIESNIISGYNVKLFFVTGN